MIKKKFNLRNVAAIVACLAVTVFTSCGSGSGSSSGRKSAKINMTTEKSGRFQFYLKGSGVATVDWGDGSEKVMLTIDGSTSFSHDYPSATIRTISINGDNITEFAASGDFNITSLDVSHCTELTRLYAHSLLKSVDLSKNTSLKSIEVQDNRLTTEALNALFGTLHSNSFEGGSKIIYVYGNPGEKTCDRSIAERKGWTVK